MKSMEDKIVLIDSNVLIRYFLKDDIEQYNKALNLIENNTCYVLSNVVQEVLYVLCGPIYNIPRKEVIKAIKNSFKDIYYIDRQMIETALDIYLEKPKLDFVDCLLVSYNRQFEIDVFSFDRKLNQKLIKT